MKDKIDMAADIPQSILANKDLIPSQQTWSWYNIFAFWMSDVHSAGGYIFAGTLFSLGLAGWQEHAGSETADGEKKRVSGVLVHGGITARVKMQDCCSALDGRCAATVRGEPVRIVELL